ncbi:hypothetical protein CU102_28095, partial [Phyllobacterium brassicacearum]
AIDDHHLGRHFRDQADIIELLKRIRGYFHFCEKIRTARTRLAIRVSSFLDTRCWFWRVATRYDKLLANFVKLAAIAIWFRSLTRHYALVR